MRQKFFHAFFLGGCGFGAPRGPLGQRALPVRFWFCVWAAVDPLLTVLPRAVPQWVVEGSSFFITINCEPRGRNHLCMAGVGDRVLDAAKHHHGKNVWNCRMMVLMPDHLHAMIVFPRDPGLQTMVSNWKKYLVRTIGVSWQKNFFDHRLRDHHQLGEKLTYVMMNPVRKGLCERSEEWPWISRGEGG